MLLDLVLAASLATSRDKKGNCTTADGLQAFTCLFRMNDFIEKIDELDMDDKNEVKEFKKSCDTLQSCFAVLNCRAKKDQEEVDVPKMIKSYCDLVVYISTDFALCTEKLETKKSKCYQDWDPFPDVKNEKDETKKVEAKKEACKTYFGKDYCLKKEITETCSAKEWTGFHNHFVNVNFFMNQCEKSQL
ncbi:unnamed protein product [Caenorhabditis sp. 36 PRJEB53466]|nr:unnamed protein product [Caenorhabditis sp. 36 PRJEB53466]